MKEKVYKENEFYQYEGGPTESFCLCCYKFYSGNNTKYGPDYDQFALISNAVYPYIRLTKKRECEHLPCGGYVSPLTNGWFASKSEQERDLLCPKIAWGFAAVFLANLRYDDGQKDYVELKDRNMIINEYYNKYLKIYLDEHNGVRYSKITLAQKELNFLAEHEIVIRDLLGKCTPLKKYTQLFEYASEAESDYENFLHKRKSQIKMNKGTSKQIETSEMRPIAQKGEKSVYIENNMGPVTIN